MCGNNTLERDLHTHKNLENWINDDWFIMAALIKIATKITYFFSFFINKQCLENDINKYWILQSIWLCIVVNFVPNFCCRGLTFIRESSYQISYILITFHRVIFFHLKNLIKRLFSCKKNSKQNEGKVENHRERK